MSAPAAYTDSWRHDSLAEGLERLDALAIEAETASYSAPPGELAILDRLVGDPAWSTVLNPTWTHDQSQGARASAGSPDLSPRARSRATEIPAARRGAGYQTLRERYRALADLHASLERLLLEARTRLAWQDDAPEIAERGLSGLTRWQERRAKDYFASNLRKAVTVAEVAQACGLSRGHFIKAFREATGETPHRWLLKFRAAKVKELLLGPRSLAEIAQECGFADQSHMTRVFRSVTGSPPGTWRRQHRC